jgi:hypothetical protein
MELVAHSPTPSMVSTGALERRGEEGAGRVRLVVLGEEQSCQRRLDAASAPASFSISSGIQSFSRIHSGMAIMNDARPRGATLK